MKTSAARTLTAITCASLLIGNSFAEKSAPNSNNISQVFQEAVGFLDGWRGNPENLEQARYRLDSILAANPNDARAHREYARYYIMRQGPRWAENTEQSLQKAISIQPNFAEAYVLKGHFYHIIGNDSIAEEALKKAENIGTIDPWLHINWAEILLAKKMYSAAATRFKKVIDSNTPNKKAMLSAYEGLIAYHIYINELDNAELLHRRLIKIEPESAWLKGNYGAFLLCTKNNPAPAMARFRDALNQMNYQFARIGLAAAIYRFRVDNPYKGNKPENDELIREAKSLADGSPYEVVKYFCERGLAVNSMPQKK